MTDMLIRDVPDDVIAASMHGLGAWACPAGARLVSLCGGAFILGQAGVLDGHQVTTHRAIASEFRAAFPQVRLVEQALYIDDGQVLTSGGMLAATDLCSHVLRQDFGRRTRATCPACW